MKTLWNSESSLAALFSEYSFGMGKDWCLIELEWELQSAHIECLYDANVLTNRELSDLQECIRGLAQDYNLSKYPCAPEFSKKYEDIHSFVEDKICELLGETGKKIHTGRSRNDQVASLIKMYLDTSYQDLRKVTCELIEVLSGKAKKYHDVPMPVTTHFQQAALGSVGHYLKMREKTLIEVLSDINYYALKNKKECPLGSGACVGSSIAIDRKIQSDLLGFKRPSINSLYSTTCRDEIIDFANLCSKLSLHLIGFVNELITWSNQNFDWIVLPSSFCTGSSMMPNKLNPDFLELFRCDLKAFLVWPNKVLLQLSSLPSGYSRDLQIVKDDMLVNCQRFTELLTVFSVFLRDTEFNEEKISNSLGLGYIDATIEMEKLVSKGVSLRDAHHKIAVRVQGEKIGSFCDGNFKQELSSYKTSGSPNPDFFNKQFLANGTRDK